MQHDIHLNVILLLYVQLIEFKLYLQQLALVCVVLVQHSEFYFSFSFQLGKDHNKVSWRRLWDIALDKGVKGTKIIQSIFQEVCCPASVGTALQITQ